MPENQKVCDECGSPLTEYTEEYPKYDHLDRKNIGCDDSDYNLIYCPHFKICGSEGFIIHLFVKG